MRRRREHGADDRETHSFRGRSMQDAVRRLKASLGPEAVIVGTRRGRDPHGRYVEITAVPAPPSASADETPAMGGRRGASAAYARTALATQPAELPPLLAALRGEAPPDKPFADRAAWLARQIEIRTTEAARHSARVPSPREPAPRRVSDRPPYHMVDPLPSIDPIPPRSRILSPAEAAAELAGPGGQASEMRRLRAELTELRQLISGLDHGAPKPAPTTAPINEPVTAALAAALAPLTARLEALTAGRPVQTQLADIQALLQQVTGVAPAPVDVSEPEPDEAVRPVRPEFESSAFVERLIAAGVPRPYAEDITRRARPRTLRPIDPMTRISQLLAEDIDCGGGDQRVMAFVGPTGVGKTTTIAKIASRARLEGKRVALITVDTFRMAAVDQLARYAEVLDAPLRVVKSPAALGPTLADLSDADLVLIDTTGRNPRAPDQVDALRRFFPEGWGGELVLTIAGPTREADVFATIDAFGDLGYGQVCITKMDETDAPGAIYAIARRAGRPVAWLTDGQMVPDDIEEADATTIAARIIAHRPRASVIAASA